MIRPQVNTECKSDLCIYDAEELVKLFRENGANKQYAFECRFCKATISLDKFFMDPDLRVQAYEANER